MTVRNFLSKSINPDNYEIDTIKIPPPKPLIKLIMRAILLSIPNIFLISIIVVTCFFFGFYGLIGCIIEVPILVASIINYYMYCQEYPDAYYLKKKFEV